MNRLEPKGTLRCTRLAELLADSSDEDEVVGEFENCTDRLLHGGGDFGRFLEQVCRALDGEGEVDELAERVGRMIPATATALVHDGRHVEALALLETARMFGPEIPGVHTSLENLYELLDRE